MYKEILYPLKIWITAVVLSPVIITIGGLTSLGGLENFLVMVFFGCLFGAMYSIPSFFVLWLTTYLTSKYSYWNIFIRKAIWSVVGMGLSILAFYIFNHNWTLQGEKIPVSLIYAAIVVSSIWFYRFNPKVDKSDEDERLLSQLPIRNET